MAGKQAQAFLLGEGDSWFERNRNRPRDNDPILQVVDQLGIIPRRILEVGCGTGWRLKRLTDKYRCRGWGIDPSEKALGIDNMWQIVEHEKFTLMRGTATSPYPLGNDFIIFGFCLYLVDREDLFKVVYETDRALVDGGHIVIHDFYSPHAFSRTYEHAPELRSYHMDNSKLWLGHPHYRLTRQTLSEETAITVLQKNMGGAFPLE